MLPKSIGRNLSCIKSMLQFTSHENDLFYMVFAVCKMYVHTSTGAVAKFDWIFFEIHSEKGERSRALAKLAGSAVSFFLSMPITKLLLQYSDRVFFFVNPKSLYACS